MEIYKKNKNKPVEPVKEPAKKAADEATGTTATLTEEQVAAVVDLLTQWSDIGPKLTEALPKLIAFLEGKVEIEIIDEEEPVEEEPVDVEELTDEPEEEPKAEDDASTFNAADILKDPAKKAAIEAALKGTQPKPAEQPKAKDEQSASKKVFVKKSLPKKAGDKALEKTNPNAALVDTPVEKTTEEKTVVTKKFDFHKRG